MSFVLKSPARIFMLTALCSLAVVTTINLANAAMQNSALLKTSNDLSVVPVVEKVVKTSRESKAVEDKLNVAAQTLRKDPEFLKAVARRDTKLTATLLSKTANVDAKVSVRFKDKVDVENLTIFIGCQQTAQGLACGIWIY